MCDLSHTYMELETKQLSSADKSCLIRTRSLINHLPFFDFRNDSMTDSQQCQEFSDNHSFSVANDRLGRRRFERIRITLQDLLKLLEGFPSWFTTFTLPFGLIDLFGKCSTSYAATPELHLVASQSTSLITEDIFNLPEFFDKRRCPAERGRVRLWIIHVKVRVDQLSLLKLDDLHRHYERNGDQIVVQDDECQDVFDELLRSACERRSLEEVPLLIREKPRSNTASNSRTNGQNEKEDEKEHDLYIDLSLDSCSFDRCSTGSKCKGSDSFNVNNDARCVSH
jgi:hypothetical protein